MKNKTNKKIYLLLEENPKWPTNWTKNEWEQFIHICQKFKLENLLFLQIKDNPPTSMSKNQYHRLNNLFDINFVHIARLKSEISDLQKQLNEHQIKLCFFKGYALIKNYYPHMAARQMEDIDLIIKGDKKLAYDLFEKNKYIKLKSQSKLEKKDQFLKILGPHTFALETHRHIHTSYLHQFTKVNLKESFDTEGYPCCEILFLSVILHHKYFECSIRDFIDLYFILKHKPDLDWQLIYSFCKQEQLSNQFFIMKKLYNQVTLNKWKTNENYFMGDRFSRCKQNFISFMKLKFLNSGLRQRSVLTKIMDLLVIFLVYDNIMTSLKVFTNKYLRYVKIEKYLFWRY